MSRPRKPATSYVPHKQSGRGRAVWYDVNGSRQQKLLPGAYGSQESLCAKARLDLELAVSASSIIVESSGLTVAEILASYLDHAERYYVDVEGKSTKELVVLKYAMKPVRLFYAHHLAIEFGPLALKAVRQGMIDAGLSRGLINRRIGAVKRIFKWAVSEELIPPGVYEALRTLPGLRQGRTAARETKPVGPVDDATVDATMPYLPPYVRVMVELMRYTGMRPSEVCAMTLGQIDRGALWIYRPTRHKTSHQGKVRAIPFGPHARAALAEFLDGRVVPEDEPLFSPKRAREERLRILRNHRKSKVQPSQFSRKMEAPQRMPGERYSPSAISHAVAIACQKAFPLPSPLARHETETAIAWKERLTVEQEHLRAAWLKSHRWHPYQLRHAFATKVRKGYGLEAAQVLLGHSRADVTQMYAERDDQLAANVAALIG